MESQQQPNEWVGLSQKLGEQYGVSASESRAQVCSLGKHYRRHLDEFQKAEIAIKFDKLFRKIARERWRQDTHFDSESGREAGVKSGISRSGGGGGGEVGNERSSSEGVGRYYGENSQTINPATPIPEERTRSSHELGREFGVSGSTIERVRSIMEHGTPEQIQSMRDEDGNSKKPGVRTMYEQVQNERIKKELTDSTNVTTPQLKKDNLRLINKDFRIATKEEIPNDSVDLVLVLDFPEPRMREDEQGTVYAQLM